VIRTEKMTQILPSTSNEAIKLACHLLRAGKLVAFPTDTIYGIGANAFDRTAVKQIFEVKARPADKALPVFVHRLDDLGLIAQQVPNRAQALLQKLWPGALTVILPKNPELPDEVTAGQCTVAVRIPDHSLCWELVKRVGHPLAVTSANLSGYPTPTTAQSVAKQLGERLPLVLDGGPSRTSQASTIVDLSLSPPQLRRRGPLSVTVLREFLPDLEGDEGKG
jgi:L-threonylcarbamoyladenylate synthase